MFHVNCHEFIADLRGVFSIVDQAELLGVSLLLEVRFLLQLDSLRFNLLLPANLIETLSEENGVHEHSAIEGIVYLLRKSEEVERENLIYEHVVPIAICKVLVVPLPAFSVVLLFFLFGPVLILWPTCCRAFCIRFGGKLDKVFVDWVILEGLVLFITLKQLLVDSLKVSKRISACSLSLGCIEVLFTFRVSSLVRLWFGLV